MGQFSAKEYTCKYSSTSTGKSSRILLTSKGNNPESRDQSVSAVEEETMIFQDMSLQTLD